MKTKIIVTGLMISIASVQTEATNVLQKANSALYHATDKLMIVGDAAFRGLDDVCGKIIANLKIDHPGLTKKWVQTRNDPSQALQIWQDDIENVTENPGIVANGIVNSLSYLNSKDLVKLGASVGTFLFPVMNDVQRCYNRLKIVHDVHGLTVQENWGNAGKNLANTGSAVMREMIISTIELGLSSLLIRGGRLENSNNLAVRGLFVLARFGIRQVAQSVASNLIDAMMNFCDTRSEFLNAILSGMGQANNPGAASAVKKAGRKIEAIESQIDQEFGTKTDEERKALVDAAQERLNAGTPPAMSPGQGNALTNMINLRSTEQSNNNQNAFQAARVTKAVKTVAATGLAYLVVTRVLPKAFNAAKKIFGK